MRTPKLAQEDIFQYTTPTVFVKSPKGDVIELDASALNAFIRKAWSAFNQGWKYQIGGNIKPDLEAKFVVDRDSATGQTDCSGFCWWSTFRKRLGTLYPDNDFFKEIADFIPGACIRYNAQPGSKFGHVVFIVNVLDGGELETLDMTQDSGYSGIFYRGPDGKFHDETKISKTTANQSWMKDRIGGTHSVVSTDAIIAINGIKYTPKKINLLLLAAKQPISTWVELAVLATGLASLIYWYKKRKNALPPE